MSATDGAFYRTCQLLFRQADTDHSGELDPAEFLALLQAPALGLQLSPAEMREVQQMADKASTRMSAWPPGVAGSLLKQANVVDGLADGGPGRRWRHHL